MKTLIIFFYVYEEIISIIHHGVMLKRRWVSCAMSSEFVLLQQKKWPFYINYLNYPPLPSSSPELNLIKSSHNFDPGTTMIGIQLFTQRRTSSTTSNVESATSILTILHLATPSARFLPSAIFKQISSLNYTSPPHFRSLSGLSKSIYTY